MQTDPRNTPFPTVAEHYRSLIRQWFPRRNESKTLKSIIPDHIRGYIRYLKWKEQ
jgi:hypothetical protein